jgi:hypothetical protein
MSAVVHVECRLLYNAGTRYGSGAKYDVPFPRPRLLTAVWVEALRVGIGVWLQRAKTLSFRRLKKAEVFERPLIFVVTSGPGNGQAPDRERSHREEVT